MFAKEVVGWSISSNILQMSQNAHMGLVWVKINKNWGILDSFWGNNSSKKSIFSSK